MPAPPDAASEGDGLARAVVLQCRRLTSTRPHRRLVAITVLLGLLGAVGVVAGSPPDQLTFASLSNLVQLLMSVTVPFLGVLLVSDLRRTAGDAVPLPSAIAARLIAACLGAAVIAVVGIGICVVAMALVPSADTNSAWQRAGVIAGSSVVVQVVAQLVGTGLGLLVRWPLLAMAGTVVLPLGLWFLLGAVDPLRQAQNWLTPYGLVPRELSGEMEPLNWAQLVVVIALWCVGLNAAGALRQRRSTTGGRASSGERTGPEAEGHRESS